MRYAEVRRETASEFDAGLRDVAGEIPFPLRSERFRPPVLVFNHQHLRALRQESQWTLEEAARRYRLSYPMVRKLESGTVRPGVDTLTRLARAFGVSIDSLFHEVAEEAPAPVDTAAIAEMWIARTVAGAPLMTEDQVRRLATDLHPSARTPRV